MPIEVDPKVDYAFKWLFGREEEQSQRLLMSLLNAVLELSGGAAILEVRLLNPTLPKMREDEYLAMLDIKCQDELGNQYNVEMQMALHKFFKERLLFYWARLYPLPLASGQTYKDLRSTQVVCFVNDVMFPEHPTQYHWEFSPRDKANPTVVLSDQMTIHIFELPKFTLALEQLKTSMDQWLYFLKHAEGMNAADIPAQLSKTDIHTAFQELDLMSHDTAQRMLYEGRLRRQLDELARQEDIAEFLAAKAKLQTEKESLQTEKESLQTEKESLQTKETDLNTREAKLQAEKDTAFNQGQITAAIKRIHKWQKRLKQPERSAEELQSLPLTELEALADSLERQVLGDEAS